jgi:flagellar motor protein MotB
MANWQDDPDLAAMRPRRGGTPWGRILVGILIVGCGTFGLAYYLPLNRAHHALTDDHARLRQKLEGVQQTLEKNEAELKAAIAKRDELESSAREAESKVAAQSSDLKSVTDGFSSAADKAIKKKAAVVGTDAAGARVAISAGSLFSSGKVEVSAAGVAMLCAIAKAAGSRPLHVIAVAKDDDIPSALQGKYSSAWGYTSAAAAEVTATLSEKCSVPGARLYAEASNGARPAASALGSGAPSPRIEILAAASGKP